MKIVVLGAGQVGFEIAKQLSYEEHDVSVVENNPEVFKIVSEKLDVKPILGSAIDMEALKEAGLTDANSVIATTSSDETNIVACQIADFIFGVGNKIARVSNKTYYDNSLLLFGKNKFAVDLKVSPEVEISNVIKRCTSLQGALDFIPCLDDKVRILGATCRKNSAWINIPVRLLSNISGGLPFSILFIERNGSSFIPSKNEVIKEEDNIYIALKPENTSAFLKLFGIKEKSSGRIVLIGSANLNREIIKAIYDSDSEMSIKIIEKDLKKAEILSELIGNAEVIYGDPLDTDIMETALAEETETVIAVTKDDRTNILACLLAKTRGAKRVTAMVRNMANEQLFYSLGVNSILDPKRAVIAKMLQYIRKGSSESILTDNDIEIFSINTTSASKAIGLFTDDINSSGKIKIAVLVRDDKIYIRPKRMVINSRDKLLFVAAKDSLPKIANLFKDKPKYLA